MPIDSDKLTRTTSTKMGSASASLAASSTYDIRSADAGATPARPNDGADIGKAPIRIVRCTTAGTVTIALIDTPNNTMTFEMVAGDILDRYVMAYVATDTTAQIDIIG